MSDATSLAADDEATQLVEPSQSALNDPSMTFQPLSMLDLASGDAVQRHRPTTGSIILGLHAAASKGVYETLPMISDRRDDIYAPLGHPAVTYVGDLPLRDEGCPLRIEGGASLPTELTRTG